MIHAAALSALMFVVSVSDFNQVNPVTLEVTHMDGKIEKVPVQNGSLCNEAITAWQGRLWDLGPSVVSLRCADYNSFAPGWNSAAPKTR